MAFPTNLTNAVDDVTEIMAAHLNNLEAKVGIDGSAVVTSLDYLLKSTSSLNPGHKHNKLWSSDGALTAVTVDVNGNVGIGTTSPTEKLHIYGTGTTQRLLIDYAGTLQVALKAGSAGYGIFGTVTNNPMRIQTYNNDRVTIDINGNVGIGTTTPNAAALLHIASTTKGFLPPVMTTTQKNAISSLPAGLVVYDSTLNKLCVYTGSAWQTVTSS